MSEISNQPAARLGSDNIKSLLVEYATPAIISMLVVSLYNIVDRIFIGQGIGAMAISGLTLTLPVMSLVAAIGTLVGVGASSRMSIVLGMRDYRWARNILGNAFILTLLLSCTLISLVMFFLDDILVALGGSEATIPYARDFLKIVIPGSIFTNLTYSFSSIIRASGFPKRAMYSMMLGVGVNIILNPIFIFGFGMGIKGSATATVIAMCAGAVFAISHFFNRSNPVHFRWKSFRPKLSIIRNITSIGLAPFMMNVTASLVALIMNNRLVFYGGDLAVGAYGIINSYGVLLVMGVMGLGQGMQPIVGYNFGAKRLKRVKDVLLLTIKASFVVMTVGFLLAELIPGLLVRAFTSDRELIAMTAKGMRLTFMVIPIVGFQIITSTFFQSISKPGKAIFMSLSRQLIFLVPALLVLSHFFGLTGIWLALPVSDLAASIIAGIFLIKERKIFYPRNISVSR